MRILTAGCMTVAAAIAAFVMFIGMDTAAAATQYTLGASVSGSGTITSSPSGINCGGTCSANFDSGTAVTLTATPSSGWGFLSWGGSCSGSTTSCTVTMDMARSVTATFGHNLTITKTGSGTATSSPSGISCGGTCTSVFANNSTVTLTSSADSGWTFMNWSVSGTTSSTSPYYVVMDADKSVTAAFGRQLSVTVSGTGTVASNPTGISCSASTCTYNYDDSTAVTLTATPGSGQMFTGWSGNCSGTSANCIVTMDNARSATATFAASRTLTVAKTGNGTIISSPSGVKCGNTCEANFADNTTVTLTAVPDSSETFNGWGYACSGTGSCTIPMTAAKYVSAGFTTGIYALNVTKTGNGSVTSSPSGINCGSDCVENYSPTTTVTLTATPASGETFSSWSGDCAGSGSCSFLMSLARSVTAAFTQNTYNVSVVVKGNGAVTSSPSGISCTSAGSNCSSNFTANTSVTLTATPSSGESFSGWARGCSGTGSCSLTMDSEKGATASFTTSGSSTYDAALKNAGNFAGDFTGDGNTDILWRHYADDGQNKMWLMNGATVKSVSDVTTIADTTWQIAGVGDFDADGKSDILWRQTSNGRNAIWLMNGVSKSSSAYLTPVTDMRWQVAGVGDFSGDGKADILWRNAGTGQNALWIISGTTLSSGAFITTISDMTWNIVGTGDFNADGKSDILWRNSSSGSNAIWLMNSSTKVSGALLTTVADTNWGVNGVGDFNADGKSDILWRNSSTGVTAVWFMNGTTVSSGAYSTTISDANYKASVVGDFNGDRKSDIFWRNSVTGQNMLWLMNSATATSTDMTTISDTKWQAGAE